MHKGARHSSSLSQRNSQSDADRCCATSEHGDSLPTSINAKAVDGPALIPISVSAALALPATRFDHVAERVSGPPTNRSRHILLSVFLI